MRTPQVAAPWSKHGAKVTGHRHEWAVQMVSDGPFGSEATDITADCDCGEMLSWDEIERRLNRTTTEQEYDALLELALKYLEHPDVQAIPFALPASAVAARIREARAKAAD